MTRAVPARPGPVGAWIQASRLPTLWAAVAPVIVGSASAAAAGCFLWGPALACLVGAVCIQLGTNYANDVYDHRKGADREDRLGPTRAVAAGWLSERAILMGMAVAFLLATAAGVYLALEAGWPVVVIGVASITAGVGYTAGPFSSAYLGLGDLFVLVFFGFVAVCGTAWVQCGLVPESAWLSAVAVGALGTAILVVNNLRDRVSDARAGKRTLVVRWGEEFGRAQLLTLVTVAYLTAPILGLLGQPGALLSLLSLPLAVAACRRGLTLDGAALNPVLGEVARLQIVFSALLAAGLVLWG